LIEVGPSIKASDSSHGIASRGNAQTNVLWSKTVCYGYYADIANECQVFHICQPVTYADGETETFKWSMICPEQTVFDQSTLVCAFPLDAIPCEESEAFMDGPTSINARFGVIDDLGSEKRK
jgi:hypothetical protein